MTKSKLDTTLDVLFEKLDQRAVKMLEDWENSERAPTDPDYDPDYDAEFASYSERARMFAEVSKYAQARHAMKPAPPQAAPPPKARAKFHDLKQRFHGNAPEGGAGQRTRARR